MTDHSTSETSGVERPLLDLVHETLAVAIAFCGRGPGGTNNSDPAKWASMCDQIGTLLAEADKRVLSIRRGGIVKEWKPIERVPNQQEVLVCCQGMRGWYAVGIQCGLGEWWTAGKHVRLEYPPTHYQELDPVPDMPTRRRQ